MDSIVLVDLNDNEIGHCSKCDAHSSGKLHRAFSIFIYSGSKMLLQKRAAHKYHSGGLWANACCSHPRLGELLETALHRRLQDELGIDCKVEKLFDFIYFQKCSDNMFEYEFDHVYAGRYSGNISLNPDEIEEIRWVEFADLKKELLESPEKFAAWFLIAAPRVIGMLESSNKRQNGPEK